MIKLVPYIVNDGIPTMSNSYIMSLLDRAEKDGVLSVIFYGDSKYTKEMFIQKVKLMRDLFFVVMDNDKVVGFGLMDNIRWEHGYIHFCVFSEFWGDCVEKSKEVYRLLHKQFSVIMGVVPVDNKFAINWAEKIGATKACVIPDYFKNDKKGYVDGAMFYTVRGEL